MQTNELPAFDTTNNETGCCPRFRPEPWENQHLHFEHKPFVRVSTHSLFHIPLDMGPVFSRTFKAIESAHADQGGFLVLSHDDSPWHAEHLFAVSAPVPGEEVVDVSGDFVTKVFEGPYSNARQWSSDMEHLVEEQGHHLDTMYFFYTTCPKCAKVYGKNYVVGVARIH